jgi:hypothetical protein
VHTNERHLPGGIPAILVFNGADACNLDLVNSSFDSLNNREYEAAAMGMGKKACLKHIPPDSGHYDAKFFCVREMLG